MRVLFKEIKERKDSREEKKSKVEFLDLNMLKYKYTISRKFKWKCCVTFCIDANFRNKKKAWEKNRKIATTQEETTINNTTTTTKTTHQSNLNHNWQKKNKTKKQKINKNEDN